MKCKCPEGWPRSEEQGFGEQADGVAHIFHIPPPRFGVTAHRWPCMLPDAPHTIPEDYSHPEFIAGEPEELVVKNPPATLPQWIVRR